MTERRHEMRERSRGLVAALLALPLLWAAGADSLQAVTIYGTLRGTVVDEQDQPLVGVLIRVSSDVAIRERGVVTDARGAYFISQLEPGDYKVIASLEGFTTIQQEALVKLDQTTVMDIKLPPGKEAETVTVTAERPVVSKTQSGSSFNLRKDFTEGLPLGRSYQTLMGLAPGVANESENDGNPNILGGLQNSNRYLLDGVS